MKRTLRWRELGILLLVVSVSTVGVILPSVPFFNKTPSFVGVSNYWWMFFADDVFCAALVHTWMPFLWIATAVGTVWLVLKRMLRRSSSKLSQGWYDLIGYAAVFWLLLVAWLVVDMVLRKRTQAYTTAADVLFSHLLDYEAARSEGSLRNIPLLFCGASWVLLIFFGLDCLVDGLTKLFKRKADKAHG